ncbi:heavy metal translocating P-type ATPase [Anaerosolibacter sp.]|uniref:heavy metal translocating P-type ATPase n=1 Tax=Anaerosolibacter sp. TaxID=1872527 RepID=UPI0039EE886B
MYYANVANNKFALPGRVRIHMEGLKSNPEYAEKICHHLSNVKGVYRITANHYTGNILLFFDEEETDIFSLERMIHDARHISVNHKNCGITEPVQDISTRDDVKSGIQKVILCGSILAGIMVKQLFVGRSPLAVDEGIFTVAAVATLVTSFPVLRKGVDRIQRNGLLNCDLLLSILGFTCIVLRESTLGLFIITMGYLSEIVVSYMDEHSKKMIQELLIHRSGYVYKLEDQKRIKITYQDIRRGDRILFESGQFIPIDGEVVKGSGALNHAVLTGESSPHYVYTGEPIYSGTTLEDGQIEVRVSETGDTTEYRKILKLVESAWKEKLDFEHTVDRYYHKMMPYTIIASLAGFVFTRDPMMLLSVLLVACPKPAYGATPMALRAAIMNAYAHGIYIKRPKSIESMSKVDKIIFDKTGTLTMGKPQVRDIIRIGENREEKVLAVAGSCERENRHPVAMALKEEAEKRGIPLLDVAALDYQMGKGIKGKMDEKEVLVGSKEMMLAHQVRVSDFKAKEKKLKQSGQSPVYVVYDKAIIGLIGIQDVLREDAFSALEEIRGLRSIDIEVISGDEKEIVNQIGLEIGADFYRGNMLPEDKNQRVETLRELGKVVAMVGDGINDCPALSRADVGIAISNGDNHEAAAGSDMVVVNGNLHSIPSMMDLSKYTMENIYQNHTLSIGLNVVGIVLALTNTIGPFGASLYKDLHSFIIMFNGMRPLRYKMNYLDR